MTAMEAGLLVFVAVLLFLLLLACRRIEWLYQKGEYNAVQGYKTDHTACIAAVAEVVGSKHEALILRQAAEAMDSPKGQHEMSRFARTWGNDTPSVPAMWLNSCAENAEARHG